MGAVILLAGEWVGAWLFMSLAFVVAVLGVTGLGWWVLRGDAINRAASLCVELLGGVAFIKSPEVAYLLAASHAIALHPPNRTSMTSALAAYTRGQPVNVA